MSAAPLVVGFAALVESQPWLLVRGPTTYKFKADHFEAVAPADVAALAAHRNPSSDR